jgi:hypothetical protein
MSSSFSTNYQEARGKFLRACEAAEAHVESFANPNLGPDGNGLFTDVGVLGPETARATLVLQSGTHGVEGFAGSGIQVALLCGEFASRLPRSIRALFIHAINPYGFAYLRRVNEDNVDLNRNFVDHTKLYPRNAEYERLATAIAPKNLTSPARTIALARLFGYAAIHGRRALRKAITQGQFSHPDGLCFGGNSESWSNRTLRSIVKSHLSGSKQIAFVDFHTGLGPRGHGELIMNDTKESPAYKRAVAWWGDRVKSTKAGEAASADLTGTLKLALSAMLPETEVTAASLEFGTVGAMQVFLALQAENWLHHCGNKDDGNADSIKAALKQAFFPDTDRWNAAIYSQAEQVVNQTLEAIS